MKRIEERLNIELGTRVPNSTTIELPSKRELNEAVGQEVKSFTGRAISGRMVRNYTRLLDLSQDLQDLAEAAQLTEKQLRNTFKLTASKQREIILKIVSQQLSSRQIKEEVQEALLPFSLRKVNRSTVEQKMEKRLLQTAATAQEILSLGQESYNMILAMLANRLTADEETKTALLSLRQMIDDLMDDEED